MESLITAAARALEAGDPLGALNRVALRNDAPSLALRGIAMAQLGDLAKAKTLLRSAVRGFGPREAVARARCVVAEAEIALVSRDLNWPPKALAALWEVPDAHAAHSLKWHIKRLTRAQKDRLVVCPNALSSLLGACAEGAKPLDTAAYDHFFTGLP